MTDINEEINVRYKGRNSHLNVVYSAAVLTYDLKKVKKDLQPSHSRGKFVDLGTFKFTFYIESCSEKPS